MTGEFRTEGGETAEWDALFNAYLEGDLGDSEATEFEQRLEADPSFLQEFETFASVIDGLGSLEFQFAPPDFVERVQGRIRSRSRGRFFTDEFIFRTRVPYEVVAVVMMVVMAAAYILMGAPPDKHLQDVKEPPPRLRAP